MKTVVLAEVPAEGVVEVPRLRVPGCSYKGCAGVSMGSVGLGYVSRLNKSFYSGPMAMRLLLAVGSVERLILEQMTEVRGMIMADQVQEPHVWTVTTALLVASLVASVLSHPQKFDGTLAVILSLTAHLTLSWHLSIGGY